RNGTRGGTPGSATLAATNTTMASWDTIFGSGGYGKPIAQYEGGYEAIGPSTSQANTCATLSIDNSYCSTTNGTTITVPGLIQNLIVAYKNDYRFQVLTNDAYRQFMGYTSSQTPADYKLGFGTDQWSLYSGDLYTPVPYLSYNAIRNFNAAP